MMHEGQFTILKNRIQLPGFRHLPLDGGWVLSYHEHLKVFHCPEKHILLLGIAWQVLPGKGTPEEEIEKLIPGPSGEISDDQLMAMEESWCGRYVLVCGDRVFLDASGMLNVFYSPIGISSDCTLLALQMGMQEKIYEAGDSMCWMPGPYTHYPQIYRLMPSQILLYTSNKLISRQLLAAHYERESNEQRVIEKFSDLFCHSLKNLYACFPNQKILIALTGGYDSRTLLALCLKAGLPASAFTLEHDRIFSGDVTVPQQLCEKTHTEYVFIKRDHSKFSQELEQEYYRWTAGLVKDEDRLFYAYHQYQKLVEMYGDIVILRSSVWSRVTEYLRREFTEDGPHPDLYDHFFLPPQSLERKSLDEYFAWCKEHPQNRLPISDVFFWEQREGCWLPAMEQGFDMMEGITSLQPLNSRILITALLDFPREIRLTKKHETMIAVYACPELGDIPYGGEKLRGETPGLYLIAKFKMLMKRLTTMGIKKTLKTYAMIFKNLIDKKRLNKR